MQKECVVRPGSSAEDFNEPHKEKEKLEDNFRDLSKIMRYVMRELNEINKRNFVPILLLEQMWKLAIAYVDHSVTRENERVERRLVIAKEEYESKKKEIEYYLKEKANLWSEQFREYDSKIGMLRQTISRLQNDKESVDNVLRERDSEIRWMLDPIGIRGLKSMSNELDSMISNVEVEREKRKGVLDKMMRLLKDYQPRHSGENYKVRRRKKRHGDSIEEDGREEGDDPKSIIIMKRANEGTVVVEKVVEKKHSEDEESGSSESEEEKVLRAEVTRQVTKPLGGGKVEQGVNTDVSFQPKAVENEDTTKEKISSITQRMMGRRGGGAGETKLVNALNRAIKFHVKDKPHQMPEQNIYKVLESAMDEKLKNDLQGDCTSQ